MQCFNNKLSFLKSVTTFINSFFLGIAKAIQRNTLLEGLQCPPILQFTCYVAIVVPLI
jgi:hypothetical protein